MRAEARALGHGGIRLVARAAEVREARWRWGPSELDSGAEPLGRPAGKVGAQAGRRPGSWLRPALLALVEPDERGDPMSPLRWTTKSTRALAAELTRQGHEVGAGAVPDGRGYLALFFAHGISLGEPAGSADVDVEEVE